MVRDAVVCHFEEASRPKIIRLHFVREELIAVSFSLVISLLDCPKDAGQAGQGAGRGPGVRPPS